jgi:hypothetical protein
MAAEGDVKELNVHRVGYDKFVSLIRVGAVISLLVALFVIFAISS